MVQRYDDEDLGRRFSRVEQVKLERRRREKVDLGTFAMNHDGMDGNDRCRRVLFEPDTNLQGWIEGELGKIAENKKKEWNFDFQRGIPANIANHQWDWRHVLLPLTPAQNPAPAPIAVPPPIVVPPTNAVSPTPTPAQTPNEGTPQKSATKSGSSKVTKPNSSAKKRLQKKITDYMNQRKYPVNGGAKKAKGASASSDSSENETPDAMAQ